MQEILVQRHRCAGTGWRLGKTAQGDGRPYQRHHPGDEGGHQACGQERYGGAAGRGERYRDQGLECCLGRIMFTSY